MSNHLVRCRYRTIHNALGMECAIHGCHLLSHLICVTCLVCGKCRRPRHFFQLARCLSYNIVYRRMIRRNKRGKALGQNTGSQPLVVRHNINVVAMGKQYLLCFRQCIRKHIDGECGCSLFCYRCNLCGYWRQVHTL